MKKTTKDEQTPPKKTTKSSSKNTKGSSAIAAASKGRSATGAAKPDANTDVRGSSGLANTGPFVSYNDGE